MQGFYRVFGDTLPHSPNGCPAPNIARRFAADPPPHLLVARPRSPPKPSPPPSEVPLRYSRPSAARLDDFALINPCHYSLPMSPAGRHSRISMMTTVAQRLSVRYVLMVAVAGAIFFSGFVFDEHLPRRGQVALAVGGLVLGVVVCGFWFRAALRVRTDACPHCQYRFVPGELRPSRCAECGKPTTVN